ncbi:MAG: hypothetical protein GY778_25030, partial [bacterium]|nr:hypothetical protein [bacterium]
MARGSVQRIIKISQGQLSLVARENQQAIGTTGAFERFIEPVTMAGPIETYFTAAVSGIPAYGIFKQELTGDVVPLILEGDPAPLFGNVFVFPNNAWGNPLGDLYFSAILSSGDPPAGLFKLDQRNGRQTSVVLNDDPAPAAGGLQVDDLSLYGTNSIGDLALQYKATDGVRRLLLLDQLLVGDLDRDDDVDLDDYDAFMVCFTGPNGGGGPECAYADFDEDGDIDIEDFAVMQDAFVECEQGGTDCNGNGVGDACEVEGTVATDCDGNGTLDECDLVFGGAPDCNAYWLPDVCDVAAGPSNDFNTNGVPDECEGFADCNLNDIGDPFDVSQGTSDDCDTDGVPDECELLAGPPFMIGFHEPDARLLRIDPADPGALSILSTAAPPMLGVAAACDGRVWGLADHGDVFEINPKTGATTLIGNSTAIEWDGAAYDCRSQILYGSTKSGPGVEYGLYRVSVTDGSAEFVGDLGRRVAGLAFDNDTKTLYGATGGTVWFIDTETAWPTLLCSNVLSTQARDLCYDSGVLYTTSANGLYSITPDPNTCVATLVGALAPGFGATRGLGWTHKSTDCNANVVPDNCDIAGGTSQDGNTNGIPDECDVIDCNSNGILDADELVVQVRIVSPTYTPFGAGYPAVFTVPAGPLTLNTVVIRCEADADLGAPDEQVPANLTGVGGYQNWTYWQNGGQNCPGSMNWREKTVSVFTWNRDIAGEEATLTLSPTAAVDPFECTGGSYGRVLISYLGDNDCNANGTPDDCDVADPAVDCNGNGVPDECDLAAGRSNDCNGNSQPDECEFADCNWNCVPDDQDISSGASPDCNGNSVPDECDLAAGTVPDCDSDGVPDDCEPDCNSNGVADDCDLADATSADCNENRIPDECDLAGGATDCNTNSVPDECELDCNGNGSADACDIAGGSSQDVNGNSVPDECELPVLYVKADAAGANNGSSWTDAYTDLQDALALAGVIPDIVNEIWVAAGVYRPTQPSGSRDRTFWLVDGVAVYGGFDGTEGTLAEREFAANATVLSGDLNADDGLGGSNAENSYHVVSSDSVGPDTIIDGFCIQGGNADVTTGDGAGVGGGMKNYLSEAVVRNCIFRNNYAVSGGGGIRNKAGGVMVVNTLFTGNNSGLDGGAVLNAGGGNPRLINCTLIGNRADRYGGGMKNNNGTTGVLTNCILWRNSDPNGIGEQSQFDGVTVFNYCCVQGWTGTWGGTGNTGGDPRLFDADGLDNTFGTNDDNARLASGASCLDAGDNTALPVWASTDLDGLDRFLDDPVAPDVGAGTAPLVDIGAFEYRADCNTNGTLDSIDIDGGGSQDCDSNGVPDECDPDCNTNGTADGCDLLLGTSSDCNANGTPDECDLLSGASPDDNTNGLPDECEDAFV